MADACGVRGELEALKRYRRSDSTTFGLSIGNFAHGTMNLKPTPRENGHSISIACSF